MDREVLKQAGLSEREIDVYLVLLKRGAVSVGKIFKESGLHRTNIYDTLEKLMGKGLVGVITQNNVKYYKASDPEKLLDYLNEKIENVRHLLPDLIKLTKTGREETNVEVLGGGEGIKTILNNIVKTGDDILWMGAAKSFESMLPTIYFKQIIKKYDEKGIKERGILTKGEEILKLKNHEYRYIPKKYNPPTNFLIYGDKVALFIWSSPMFVISICNKEVVETYKKYFEFMWRFARK